MNAVSFENSIKKAIDFEDAIRVPLLACAQAQRQASDAALSCLKACLQSKTRNGPLEPVMLTLQFIDDNGNVQLLRIPLLSLIPIPSLSINDINFHYQADVKTSNKKQLTVKYSCLEREYIKKEELACKMDIRLHAGVADMSPGLAKLCQLIENACTRT